MASWLGMVMVRLWGKSGMCVVLRAEWACSGTSGSCMVEFTSGHNGLCADIVHPRGMSMWAEAECLGAEAGSLVALSADAST